LSLKSCPYRAKSFSHHRPRIQDSIEVATILTRGGTVKAKSLYNKNKEYIKHKWINSAQAKKNLVEVL
ncbi:hypothetical protein, partial [Zoogloea sp.]|uniref:hypothetical protein n=1 Tax=Zoogloea sp. TaxID=49181 RepID=UPI0035ADF89F